MLINRDRELLVSSYTIIREKHYIVPVLLRVFSYCVFYGGYDW
uniref:Uncharacterized protein n=1 Tax=uncultured marine crenarchaeote HF4000_APKG5B22 TaxID=455590 RepID=B3T880_9ARCH|nr:hypothetical protein ALOHA_HF4000APKG5B22ctg2g27 [uncultured marine crenarchaeote HF4000_APKG5B22]